ncbi:MAG: M23 family metallopeptidase [Rhodospirillales bacterium]|nr:M23 family metallopeptidase [Rhodospirillales bacterium]
MRGLVVFAVVMMLAWSAEAEVPLTLTGNAAEGGLLVGKTAPGAAVAIDGKPVMTDAVGNFLLGFGRDDAGTKRLTVSSNGETLNREIIVTDRDFKIERIDGLPQKKVTPDPEAIKRIVKEKAEMAEAKKLTDPSAYFLSGFAWPATGRISGVYGSQRVLNGKPRRPHYGTDVAAPIGTPVVAMAAGKVTFVHPGMFFNGKTVLIDHGLGLRSVYIHLSDTDVKAGDKVGKGTRIGAIGKTGRATGPHLHFGLTLDEIPIDPELILGEMPK